MAIQRLSLHSWNGISPSSRASVPGLFWRRYFNYVLLWNQLSWNSFTTTTPRLQVDWFQLGASLLYLTSTGAAVSSRHNEAEAFKVAHGSDVKPDISWEHHGVSKMHTSTGLLHMAWVSPSKLAVGERCLSPETGSSTDHSWCGSCTSYNHFS